MANFLQNSSTQVKVFALDLIHTKIHTRGQLDCSKFDIFYYCLLVVLFCVNITPCNPGTSSFTVAMVRNASEWADKIYHFVG